MNRKKIVFYSQHLIGVGHHFRNRAIVRELIKAHDVYFIDGGRPIPGAELPDPVQHLRLPPLQAGPRGLVPSDNSRDLENAN